jgi:hypothetical protein
MTRGRTFARIVLLATILIVTQFATISVHAQAGCCMQREATGGSWFEIGRDLNQCRQFNAAQDSNDNVFEPTGFIWWNIRC